MCTLETAAGIWSQQAYIKASNPDAATNAEAGDRFAYSLALSGDTLAVGAHAGRTAAAAGIDGDQSDNSARWAGAVYVFTRDGAGIWSQQAYIKASNPDAEDLFGFLVALSGDTLAVSAIREDGNATGIDGDQSDNSAMNAGAAYVFTRDGAGVWSQQAYIKASNTDAGDAVRFRSLRTVWRHPDGRLRQPEASNATGIGGDQSNNNANRLWCGLCVHARRRWDLVAASLYQGVQPRCR